MSHLGEEREIIYPDAKTATIVHDKLIQEFGGLPGVRDIGALHSALARPVNLRSYDKDADLSAMAAALAAGIVQDHPFADGNKRTAFLLMFAFLEANGQTLNCSDADVVSAMVDLAAHKLTEDEFAQWIRESSAAPEEGADEDDDGGLSPR